MLWYQIRLQNFARILTAIHNKMYFRYKNHILCCLSMGKKHSFNISLLFRHQLGSLEQDCPSAWTKVPGYYIEIIEVPEIQFSGVSDNYRSLQYLVWWQRGVPCESLYANPNAAILAIFLRWSEGVEPIVSVAYAWHHCTTGPAKGKRRKETALLVPSHRVLCQKTHFYTLERLHLGKRSLIYYTKIHTNLDTLNICPNTLI